MRKQGLVAYAMVVAILMVGCAKTPATTTAGAPAPSGTATTTSDGSRAPGVSPGSSSSSTASTRPTSTGGARVVPSEYQVVRDLEDVHFDYDKYDIGDAAAKALDTNAAWLARNADRLVLIEGHCDERGTTEYNVALGERRAKATMNYLVARGVAAHRISIVSYGEERPACTQHNESCWAKNRRAHFLAKRG